MNERQIISLAIRIIGLLGILYVVKHWAYIYHKTGGIHFEPGVWGIWWKFIFECCLILIGVYMVSGARLLIKFMTKDSENKPKDKE
jgi:hypothetical protein